MERIQKYLAARGICSRRAAEDMIRARRVRINGETALIGQSVSEGDSVALDGVLVGNEPPKVYIMLHKPDGYVTTAKDQFGRPCVLDLLKDVKERIYPVGRLDYDTSGLLLLTNDGALAQKLTHPRCEVEKVYIARVKGHPGVESLKLLADGVMVDGEKTLPAKVTVESSDDRYTRLRLTIRQGRNRQVRKMLAAVGLFTAGLTRVATGRLYLGRLKKGEYRVLTREEIAYLKSGMRRKE
jgi:pseudouridine synthase